MALTAFRRVRTNNPDVEKAMQPVQDAFSEVLPIALLDGVALTSVSLSAGTTEVPHKLQRAPIGWVLTRKRGAGDVYDSQDGNPNASSTLKLTASAAVNVDLWVY